MRKSIFSAPGVAIAVMAVAVFSMLPVPAPTLAEDLTVHFGGSYGVTYTPREITVQDGDTVTWQGDFAVHPLASDDNLWSTQNTGNRFSHTFRNTGTAPITYRYYSTLQGGRGGTGMSGTVTVLPLSASPSPSSSPGMTPFSDVSANSAYAEAIRSLRREGILEGYADGTFRSGNRINRAEFTKIVMADFLRSPANGNSNVNGPAGNSNANGNVRTNGNANLNANGNSNLNGISNSNANASSGASNANGNGNANANTNTNSPGAAANANANAAATNSNANGTSNTNGGMPSPSATASATPFLGNCFNDVRNEWHAQWICQAKEEGIVRGYPDGRFHPEREISFVEAAKIIVRAMIVRNADEEAGERWFRAYVMVLSDRAAIPSSITTFGQAITRGEMAYRIRNRVTDRPSRTYHQIEAASR